MVCPFVPFHLPIALSFFFRFGANDYWFGIFKLFLEVKNRSKCTSLYTNIPHSDGIEACKEIWESRSVEVPPADCLVTMLTVVLKKNNFTFNGDHYLEINGTAMGTKMAPSYANTFKGIFEATARIVQIYWWCGYEVVSEWWRITELSFTCQ